MESGLLATVNTGRDSVFVNTNKPHVPTNQMCWQINSTNKIPEFRLYAHQYIDDPPVCVSCGVRKKYDPFRQQHQQHQQRIERGVHSTVNKKEQDGQQVLRQKVAITKVTISLDIPRWHNDLSDLVYHKLLMLRGKKTQQKKMYTLVLRTAVFLGLLDHSFFLPADDPVLPYGLDLPHTLPLQNLICRITPWVQGNLTAKTSLLVGLYMKEFIQSLRPEHEFAIQRDIQICIPDAEHKRRRKRSPLKSIVKKRGNWALCIVAHIFQTKSLPLWELCWLFSNMIYAEACDKTPCDTVLKLCKTLPTPLLLIDSISKIKAHLDVTSNIFQSMNTHTLQHRQAIGWCPKIVLKYYLRQNKPHKVMQRFVSVSLAVSYHISEDMVPDIYSEYTRHEKIAQWLVVKDPPVWGGIQYTHSNVGITSPEQIRMNWKRQRGLLCYNTDTNLIFSLIKNLKQKCVSQHKFHIFFIKN
jgi:hypothetical protein